MAMTRHVRLVGLALCAGCHSEPTPPTAPLARGCAAESDLLAPLGVVEVWEDPTELFGLPEGSPALCDLDGDGVQELILPLAPPEPSLAEVAVYDAITGDVRWRTGPGDDNYGVPYCVDVDQDGVLDVLLSGRSKDVTALDGRDGSLLWTLSTGEVGFHDGGNTYSVVSAPDSELLLATQGGGGGPTADGSVFPDIPGRLLIFDASGALLATWVEPESAEIYASPAVLRLDAQTLLIAVGAGGERLSGNLHLIELNELTLAIVERASLPSACATGGFVPSPVFGDLTGDGQPEVVATDFCGTVHAMALDGTPLWTADAGVPYSTSNPLLADVTGDGLLDVVAAFESLNFSYLDETRANPHSAVLAVQGFDGALLWTHPVPGRQVFGSPVSTDLDGDSIEDVLLMGAGLGQVDPELFFLSGIDGGVLFAAQLGETASTPVLDDVDGNGSVDLFFADGAPSPGTVRGLRLEICGRPYDPGAAFSGFRGRAGSGTRVRQ